MYGDVHATGKKIVRALCPRTFRLCDVIIRCVPQRRNFVVGPPLPYVRRLRYARRSEGFRQVGSTRRTEASARPGWSPSYANRAYVVPEHTSRLPSRLTRPGIIPRRDVREIYWLSGFQECSGGFNGSTAHRRSVPVNSWTAIWTVCGLLRGLYGPFNSPRNRNEP